MRIFAQEGPLYSAIGTMSNNNKKVVIVFLYQSYEDAQKQACSMIYQSYKNVSVERVEEIKV